MLKKLLAVLAALTLTGAGVAHADPCTDCLRVSPPPVCSTECPK